MCARVSYMPQPFDYCKPNRGIPGVRGWVGPSAGLGIRRKDKLLVLLVFEPRLLCFPTHSLVNISTELSSSWFTNYLVLIINNLRLQAGFIASEHPSSVNYIYRVIHKSLRNFRTRLRNNQDIHGRKDHINR